MKRQIVTLILAVLMLLSFCSCGTTPQITITRGTINGNVYTNESTGITLTIPDSMIFATDNEIAELQNLSKDIITNGENIFEAAKLTSFIDVMANDPYTGNNLNITYEDLSKSFSSNITTQQYTDLLKQQLSATGLSYTFGEVSEITLGGETYTKLLAQTEYMGIPMTQGLYVRKLGNYMIAIAITVVGGNDLSPYEAMFS